LKIHLFVVVVLFIDVRYLGQDKINTDVMYSFYYYPCFMPSLFVRISLQLT